MHGLRQEAAAANSAVFSSSKLLLAQLSEVVHHTRGMRVIPSGAYSTGRGHFGGRSGRQVSTDKTAAVALVLSHCSDLKILFFDSDTAEPYICSFYSIYNELGN